jgi:hypothetical protein
MFRIAMSVLLLITVALSASAAYADDDRRLVTYRVTLDNLTSAQIFSPPIFVAHRGGYRLFRVGRFASDELRLIAEDGNNGPAAAQAQLLDRVFAVQALSAPLLPGAAVTVDVVAPKNARLSLAAMLVQTNDGFVGADRLKLPDEDAQMFYLNSYDAGTEANNERAAYVPGPPFGGTLRAPTHQRIHQHPGILGVGDVDPAVYNWSDPAARLTITVVEE